MSWKRITSIVMVLCMLMSVWALPVISAASVDTADTAAPTTADRLSIPMVGIDVSSWNQEIDWAKVKAAGVEFAIVRVFHHLKNTPNYELDEQFERNVSEAQKYGIQLGAYFFSYAQNLDAIEGEAKMVVNELNKYPGVFTFPIVFDAEDGDTTDDPDVSGNDIYDIGGFAGEACKKFCNVLSANGYYPMVYSYGWYYEEKIGMENVRDYDLWLASYPRSNDKQIYAGTGPADAGSIDHSKREKLSLYDSNVTMWQYTGAGKIDGIYYGDGGAIVDLNVCYVDYPSIIKSGGYNGCTESDDTKTEFQTQPLTYRTGANGPAATYQSSKYYDHVTSIGLTGDGVTDTLAVGLSQLGYYEGTASNPYSGLYNTYDQYTTNKTTEYVYNYGDADGSGYKMAWCASFCSWSLYQGRVTNHSTHAQSCRNNIGNKTYIWRECSCYQWADQLKRFGMYSERGSYTPKAGDLIFFKMDGGGTAWTNHIGLVRYCDGSTVYTVEGNRHNHVGLYSYSLSDSQICGYGKLPYPTNSNAPKVDYSGKNKTEGQYITNNVTLSVSNTKGGSAAFTVGKYEMFDVTGFDGGYAKVSYKGSTGYATLNSNTIQVTASNSAYVAQGMDVSVDAASIKNSSFAAGSGLPAENNNDHNPNIYVTGLREDSNCYKGLENYGSNKDKIMINGRTWDKWESRSDNQILNNIWIYGVGSGKAYLGIDIADTSRLRVQGTKSHGEEIETIVIKRGFEIVKTASDKWSGGELSADGSDVEEVVGIFKENVILVANDSGGFDVYLGGSDSLGLEGYTFTQETPQILKVNNDVNIRSGPGSSYSSMGIAYSGDSFEYLGEAQGNFHKIDYNGQIGWISVYNNLSSLVNVPDYVVITSYEVNVRSGPDTSYSVLGSGFNGDRFEYLGEIQNDKWLKVNYNGQEAWISNVNATIESADKVVGVTAKNLDWDETPIVHTFGEWVDETPATCTQGGTQKRICEICELEETRGTAATDHNWDAGVITTPATCTDVGVMTYTCQNDANHTYTSEIPAQDHSYSSVVTQPDCTEGGYTTHTCTVCGYSYTDAHTDALGHSPSEPVRKNEIAATCGAEGSYEEVTYCIICGEESSREHKVIPIDKNAHNWNEWVETKAPTKTEPGEETRTCKDDPSHKETREIPPVGSSEDEVTYKVSYNKTENFTVKGKEIAEKGKDYSFTVEAAEGFKVYAVICDMKVLEAVDGVYTVKNVQGDIELLILAFEAPAEPQVKEFTVTFIGFDGAVISKQTVAYGTAAVVPEVPAVEGYKFTGWDAAFDNIVSDTTVTAQYKKVAVPVPPATTGVLKIDVTGGNNFTIAVGGGSARPQGTSYLNRKMLIGTSVIVVAPEIDGITFIGWMNEAGAIVSTTSTHTFSTTGNDYFKAVYQTIVEGVNIVAFKNAKAAGGNGQILDMQYYAAGDEVVFPDAPSQAGYTFTGWSMTAEEIEAKLSAGEDVTVVAKWEIAKIYIDVAVNGGKITTEAQPNGKYVAYAALTVVANAAPEGQKFAYWTDADGTILSYNEEYKSFPAESIELTAVYVAQDEAVKRQALVFMAADPTTEGEKITYTISWDVDASVGTIKNYGLMIVDADDYNEDTFYHGSGDSKIFDRAVSTAKVSNTTSVGKSESLYDHTYYAVAFVIYTNAAGESITVYSDMVEVYKQAP